MGGCPSRVTHGRWVGALQWAAAPKWVSGSLKGCRVKLPTMLKNATQEGDHKGSPAWRHTERRLHVYLSASGRWVVGWEVGSSKGVAVSQACSTALGLPGQQSECQIYDSEGPQGCGWAPQVVSMWSGPWDGPVQRPSLRSTLPAPPSEYKMGGQPAGGLMQQEAGRARATGTAGAAEGGRGEPVGEGKDYGLWAMVVATEVTMLEGEGPTETGPVVHHKLVPT